MLAFTSSGISLADAVAVLQLVNGTRQLILLMRGQAAAGPADSPAGVATPLLQAVVSPS